MTQQETTPFPLAGPVARLRAARRRVALLTSPESRRAKGATLVGLLVLTGVIATLTAEVGVSAAPPLMLAVPVVLGGLLLELPSMRVLLGAVTVALIAEVSVNGWHAVRPGSVIGLVVIGAIAMELVRDRERLGMSIGRRESMLLDLRDQLERQGEMPPLPNGWHAAVAQRSAGGSAFGGDFLVSTCTDHGKLLEIAVVDVSGKGVDAGTRALLLSGALGGLLGSAAPERFLESANNYLLRQEWEEGFATALHVTIDLATGRYRVANAGHPPVVHYAGGSGVWRVVEQEGTILGLHAEAVFDPVEGELARHDALLLYTDGLVEMRGRDLADGIDRLLGAAENLIPTGFTDGAQRLLESVAPDGGDDSALVLIWRS